MSESVTACKVFISYAHEDEEHREELDKHLRALERQNLIEIWHDRKITGGREWAGAIDSALQQADIVLLLISADFLNSDYCNDVELTEAIRMHDTGRVRIVPVILRSCDWQHSRFSRFNALPSDGLPIVESLHPDSRYTLVAKGLRRIIDEIQSVGANFEDLSLSSAEDAGLRPETRQGEEIVDRHFTINKLSFFGIEVGPLVLTWSSRALLKGGFWVVLLLGLLSVGSWNFLVRGSINDAHTALRIARYDSAQEALDTIPSWLKWWPGSTRLRSIADLGRKFYEPSSGESLPDWEQVGALLRRLQTSYPDDAHLMVLEATHRLRRDDYDGAREMLERVTRADPMNAEAWFLLGNDRVLGDDLAAAEKNFRRAVDLAPDSPQYRDNLGRVLLELHQPGAAIEEFRQIGQFPLARVEQALAHWLLGEWRYALDAQRDALALLADPGSQQRFYNRRAWQFILWAQGIGVRLASTADKQCYVALGEAASQRLAGADSVAFPPETCLDPPQEIRQLVVDDLCRFVDRSEAEAVLIARRLRRLLDSSISCGPSEASQAFIIIQTRSKV